MCCTSHCIPLRKRILDRPAIAFKSILEDLVLFFRSENQTEAIGAVLNLLTKLSQILRRWKGNE